MTTGIMYIIYNVESRYLIGGTHMLDHNSKVLPLLLQVRVGKGPQH